MGAKCAARNLSRNKSADSVHNQATANEYGFRGGPVRADNHMNQFVPVMLEIFGREWFEHGHLSLDFKAATLELEEVQVYANQPEPGSRQIDTWMEGPGGSLVCKGTAGIGDASESALQTKKIIQSDPSKLRICKNLSVGMDLGTYQIHLPCEDQFERYDHGLISHPIKNYRETDFFNGIIACPSTYLELLWRAPTVEGISPRLPEGFVGLFGAIEICNVQGPLFLEQTYTVKSELIALGETPKTEFIWHAAQAYDDKGNQVATLRMMQRILKASSELYTE